MTGPSAERGGKEPDTVFTEATTRLTMERACRMAGLDPSGARLLRLGENAMFHLASPVVVRVARTTTYEPDVRTEVAVARWLQDQQFPAVRALAVDQPVTVDGRVVTFWESVSQADVYGTTSEIAALLVRLHALVPPSGLGLRPLRPFARADRRIETNGWLTPTDRTFLLDRLEALKAGYARLEFALPAGVIHGDASVGNVIHDDTGHPVLIDVAGFAIGPREWDLVLTAMYHDSFGWHTEAEYKQFAEVYGFDIVTWPGYPVLRDVREFLMVTWLSQKAGQDEQAAAEVRKRITVLRTGASRRDWQPY